MNLIKELQTQVTQLNTWTKAYDEGKPLVSDKTWDEAYFKLQQLERKTGIYLPNSPTQTINYEVKTELKKIKHDIPMLSADKTKDWQEFLNYFYHINPYKDVIGMLKLDGLSGRLKYINGKLVEASTRGSGGEIGEDVTHNALVIKNIPKKINYTNELVIDGEFIITDEDFKPFSDEYANSRNLAAGSIRLLDSKECAKRNLTFVVWNVVIGLEGNSFIHKLNQAEQLGFTVTPWTSSFDWDAKEFLIDEAKKYGYPFDGLIGKFDDIEFGLSLGNTSHHPKYLMAFKFYDELYETTLKSIEYDVSRNGEMVPVAIFEPVIINSNIISRASLHNLSVMKDILGERPYIGQKIKVYLSNMIIPQIKGVNKECQDVEI